MTAAGSGNPVRGGTIACLHRRSTDPTTQHETFHDWLTGLPNRAAFRRRLGHVLDKVADGGPPVSVVVLAVDRFKETSDELGPRLVARVLAHVTHHLLPHVPPPSEVASLGNGEFAVLVLDDRAAVASTAMAIEVLRALQAPLVVSGRSVPVRARAGITSTRPGQSVDEVLRNAYTALALTQR